MKPIKAWAVVDEAGELVGTYKDESRAEEAAVLVNDRVIRVEIREVKK